MSDITIGNGVLTYQIGLLTPDEASIAGLINSTGNISSYLYTNQHWWTLTSSVYYNGYAHVWFIGSENGSLYFGNDTVYPYGVRGVLNLKSDTPVTGTGSTSDPYKVM